MEEPLKVSDWSQKYKLALYTITLIGVALFVWWVVMPWGGEVINLLKQIEHNTSPIRYA